MFKDSNTSGTHFFFGLSFFREEKRGEKEEEEEEIKAHLQEITYPKLSHMMKIEFLQMEYQMKRLNS